MNKKDAEDLIERYHTGNVSDEERAIIETWYLSFRANNQAPPIADETFLQYQQESMGNLLEHTRKGRLGNTNLWRRMAAAASVIFVMSLGIYLFIKRKPLDLPPRKTIAADLLPGANKVTLTLSNGSQVVLTGAKNGRVASDAGVAINKTADGSVSYAHKLAGEQNDDQLFNVATTPRGGQYQFTLSDGTKVWLNAATTLKFPVAFKGNERKVELNGEAYFEVAHDAGRPFRVVSKDQTAEVLGTHFNINSYEDESVLSTTLLEGSIKVVYKGNSKIIKPGEQARLKANQFDIVKANTEQVIAWKNGLFYFQDANLNEVMRQLSRWYDVDVKFEGNIPPREFSGGISRNVKASQILDILSFKKIHYKIQGRTIIITP
ncbi:FecR family protein [Mucilaginibacter paludis]|uniref:Anti-FecI sigma factor, FecR n=1 Tax=Mucilaginibacter paludis DSM 18603 TaxID=714943 RepID=H1YIY0_9SPHI|nr:FecR family protein [Mucilaginibacter paludis]EHQ27675.1 anti-FecI sigma factor, FecR [Mucilaginibacter paludis DSM 18603]